MQDLSALHRSRSTNSLIVRTYKQATQLYLTKRFKEALETLEPIVTPQQQPSDNDTLTHDASAAAPVAQSSKGTRIKVWLFYLSLLHAIIDLGPEHGKSVIGSTRWKVLANKARDGSVWDEIIRAGYGGQEGDVDADVVVNLATLLLAHMSCQKSNQQKLEAWLATSDSLPTDGGRQVSSHSTPKALATRLKILELYALHVLPANEEWEYAREFIGMNDSLDDERKEAFMHALQQLKQERDGTALRERELVERREKEMEEERKRQEAEEAQRAEERRRDEERFTAQQRGRERSKAGNVKSDGSAGYTSKPPNANGAANSKPTPNAHYKPTPSSRQPAKTSKKPPAPPPTLYHRASFLIDSLQRSIYHASRSMTSSGSTFAMFRMLLFMFAFVMLIARRDLRMRIRRAMEEGWVKVQRTVGMGVKVSYI